MRMSVYNVWDIANYVIFLANKEKDEDFWLAEWITQLKLQKILYFIQAASLVYLNWKAFEDPILAWKYWPVVESIFLKYKWKDREPLIIDKWWKSSILWTDIKILIKKVWNLFWDYSASRLVEITHQHEPWKKTVQWNEISIDDIKDFYTDWLTL